MAREVVYPRDVEVDVLFDVFELSLLVHYVVEYLYLVDLLVLFDLADQPPLLLLKRWTVRLQLFALLLNLFHSSPQGLQLALDVVDFGLVNAL